MHQRLGITRYVLHTKGMQPYPHTGRVSGVAHAAESHQKIWLFLKVGATLPHPLADELCLFFDI